MTVSIPHAQRRRQENRGLLGKRGSLLGHHLFGNGVQEFVQRLDENPRIPLCADFDILITCAVTREISRLGSLQYA